MRLPFTIRHLTLAVAAQLTGGVVIWYQDPHTHDDPLDEDGWSLTTRTILAIFERFTQSSEGDQT
jgi:hypothetical protein